MGSKVEIFTLLKIWVNSGKQILQKIYNTEEYQVRQRFGRQNYLNCFKDGNVVEVRSKG